MNHPYGHCCGAVTGILLELKEPDHLGEDKG